MTGPRFEQTDLAAQPRTHAAIELIHAVPVTWVDTRVVVCDGVEGEGGNTGHPRVFVNVDKQEIAECGYCGKPFVGIPDVEGGGGGTRGRFIDAKKEECVIQ